MRARPLTQQSFREGVQALTARDRRLAGIVERHGRPAGAGLHAAETALLDLPGIGPWTAGVYLLMALRRPDVWPPGDLGLHKSMMEVRCLPHVP